MSFAPILLVAAALAFDDPLSLGPLGGSATSIWVDPADADVLLVTDPIRGLRRSEDGGLTFAPFGSGLPSEFPPQALTADPQSSALFVASDDRIFRSLDGGQSWSPLLLDADGGVRSISLPSSGTAILAATDSSVYRAATQTGTWNLVATGLILSNVTFAPSDASVAFYGSFDGVFKSTDGGASFDPAGTFTEWAMAVSVAPTDPLRVLAGTFGGVFASSNGGASFAPTTGSPATSVLFFAWDPNVAGRAWVGVLDGLWFSDDSGANWNQGNDGFPFVPPIPLDMDFATAAEGGHVFVVAEASNGGLWRSFGDAPPWVHIGFNEVEMFDTLVASPGGTRAASAQNGVFIGAPGETLASSGWQADFGTHTEVMVVDPLVPSRWLTGGVGAFIDNARIVGLEMDGIKFAGVFYEQFGGGRVEDIVFDPFDPTIVLAGLFPVEFGGSGIVRSTDSGFAFFDVPNTEGYGTRSLTFDPFQSGRVLAYLGDNRWTESADHGASFGPLQPPFPGTDFGVILAFDPFTPERLYRGVIGGPADGAGLLRTDGGTSGDWTSLKVSLHERSDLLLHPQIPELLFVSDGESRVLISGDGGKSFETIFKAPAGNSSGLALDTLDGNLVIGTTGASTWELPGASPYVVRGEGTVGTGGFVPRLLPIGGLPQPGNMAFGLAADRLLGGRNSLLLVSVHEGAAPLFGGTLFALPPFLLTQVINTGGTPGVGGSGSFTRVFGVPNQVSLLGVSVVAQLVVADPGGPLGHTRVLSNGLRITFGP